MQLYVFLLFFHNYFPPGSFPIFVFFCIFTPPFSNLGGLRFGVDGDGNYGYYGADDSLIPFKRCEIKSQTITITETTGNFSYHWLNFVFNELSKVTGISNIIPVDPDGRQVLRGTSIDGNVVQITSHHASNGSVSAGFTVTAFEVVT